MFCMTSLFLLLQGNTKEGLQRGIRLLLLIYTTLVCNIHLIMCCVFLMCILRSRYQLLAFMKVAIFGGAGFVGMHVAEALSDQFDEVLCIDIAPSLFNTDKENIRFIRGSITDGPMASMICKEAEVLVIIASAGMSGPNMMDKDLCFAVNVGGIHSILDACQLEGSVVQSIIYTSSYNVCFHGEPILQGNEENTPPLSQNSDIHTDFYSQTKTIAEAKILAANWDQIKRNAKGENKKGTTKPSRQGRNPITTLSLRPAAIYGEGECRHLPRIMRLMDQGLYTFAFSKDTTHNKALTDWVHIENLTQAYVKSVEMSLSNPEVVGGEAFFISDGTPVDSFEFLTPIAVARHAPTPSLRIPFWIMMIFGFISELVFMLDLPFLLDPFEDMLLTRAEVMKVGVSHFFSIDKARELLGYEPTVTSQEGSERLAKFYSLEKGDIPIHYYRFPALVWVVPILVGMGLISLMTFFPTSHAGSVCLDFFSPFFSYFAISMITYAAWLTHVGEASYAFYLARYKHKIAFQESIWWFITAFFIGFPSLKFLKTP